MSDEYRIVSEFCYCGKPIVTVRIGDAAHVMSQEEWNKVYSRNHQDRWKTKVAWNWFKLRENIVKARCLKRIISSNVWRKIVWKNIL